jgi:hypothetical protein
MGLKVGRSTIFSLRFIGELFQCNKSKREVGVLEYLYAMRRGGDWDRLAALPLGFRAIQRDDIAKRAPIRMTLHGIPARAVLPINLQMTSLNYRIQLSGEMGVVRRRRGWLIRLSRMPFGRSSGYPADYRSCTANLTVGDAWRNFYLIYGNSSEIQPIRTSVAPNMPSLITPAQLFQQRVATCMGRALGLLTRTETALTTPCRVVRLKAEPSM